MHVVILGSGVVGVASAWYLARAGHQVTVLDRQPDAALETSAGNAGQISPGYAAPWAAPGVPLKAIKWMFQRHAPLAIRLDGSSFQLEWMWNMLRNCDMQHYQQNKSRMVRIAEYSRDCLKALREETGIAYEGRQGGTLQLFRTQQQFDSASKDIEVLREAGVPYELLHAHELSRVEPALARKLKADGEGWIVPSDAAPFDYGLVILRNPPSAINPIPLFDGSRSDLTAALKEAGRKVTQAGYPEDHLDTLYSHSDCLITGWAQRAVLSHQCDTLPGDSGSPLLLKNENGWQLIAVQSSAPAAKDRYLADNRAIAVTSFRDRLEALAQ